MAIPDQVHYCALGDILLSVEGGVSVNSESRQVREGELGVLMTSAVTYGVFDPTAHKAVIPDDVDRARKPVRAGTVLFSRMNTPHLVGATVFVDRDYPHLFLPDRLWELVTREDVSARWLCFLLSDSQTRRVLSELASGTSGSMKNISKEKLLSVSLRVPPLPEQKKIAAILSSVDEVIAKTEAVIAQLQIVKKAMMEQLLTKGMPGRHTRFKQTEIGEIPEEWEVVELSVVTTRITKGESPNWQGFAYQDQGTVFVTSENVRDGFLLLDPLKFVPIEFANKVRRSRLASGDILVNLVGASIGRACIWSGEFLDANVNQAVAVISPEKTLVHSRWILEMLYTAHGQRYFGLSKVDSARPNVSLANLREFPLPLPSLAEQSEIVGIAASLVESMRLEERALKCLQSLKTALSSSLLSGEIRVIPEVAE